MGQLLFGAVPSCGSFWIRLVFPLIIHSDISVSCKHLFIAISFFFDCKSFVDEGDFFNPCIPSRPGVFQFGISLVLPGGVFRVFTILFPCCLSIGRLYYDLSVPIFCSKIVLFLSHPVDSMTSSILPLLADRIFLLFWNVLFCLYYLSPRVVLFVRVVLLFSLHLKIFSCFSFVLAFLLVVDVLSVFPI